MAGLSIRLLGSFEAFLEGEEVLGFESDKVRALLAYLVVEAHQPHRREKLADLFWPELSESQARLNLRRALYNLRKITGDEKKPVIFLNITARTLQFNPQGDHWLDISAFKGLLDAVKAHRHRVLWGCDPCLEKLQEAVELYRGDFLNAISLEDNQRFEEWVLLEREHLRRQALEVLENLVEAHQHRNEVVSLLRYAECLVELDPWNETGQRGMMRALALSGQRNAALAQYDACRSILMNDLGVEPEPATVELYERIRFGDKLSIETRVPPNNLPASIPLYVERKEEENRIKECLGDLDCRLCTLVSPGGSGKTLLALKVAGDMLRQFEHGVFFVPFEPLDSPEDMVSTIASSLGFTFYPGVEPRQQLFNYLGNKSMLLILDNFEHLLDGVDLVVELLNAAAGVVILATSRARLNVQVEHTLQITGMKYPQWDTSVIPETVSINIDDYDALQLFTQSARRIKAEFTLDHSNIGHVARICKLVDGMPLGIVLAASWLKLLSPEEILIEIEKGLDFIATDMRDIPARHRSMQAVFDHSWRLLSEEEKKVFRALTVFRGGFTLEAALQITAATIHDLKTFVDRSLLQRDENGRFIIHRLLRQYGSQQLEALRDEFLGVKDRHCAYYAAAIETWGEELKGHKQLEAFKSMGTEIRNAHTAWIWAVEKRKVSHLDQALDGLCYFYEWHADLSAGEAACQLVRDRLIEEAGLQKDAKGLFALDFAAGTNLEGDAAQLRLLSRVLSWQAKFLAKQGQFASANELALRSIPLLELPALIKQDTRQEKAFALHCLAEINYFNDLSKAKMNAEQSLALYHSLEDTWGIADAMYWVGGLETDIELAIQMFEESISLRRTFGDRKGIAETSMVLCNYLARLNRIDEGIQAGNESLAIFQDFGTHFYITYGMTELAAALSYNGQYEESRIMYRDATQMKIELGMLADLPSCYMALGHVELLMGLYAKARYHAQIALALAKEQGNIPWLGYSLVLKGAIALVESNYAEAKAAYQESIEIIKNFEWRDSLGATQAALGIVLHRLGDHLDAKSYFFDALSIATETGAMYPFLWSLPGVALMLVDEGEIAYGVELYALASRYPRVANSQWFDDIAGKHIRAAAERLPPEEAAAAEERGRARDRKSTIKELLAWLEKEIAAEADRAG